MKALPDAILQKFVELLQDIEEGGPWPEFAEAVFTTMIEKTEDPNAMEVEAKLMMAPEPMGMRPINNFSPWYSAWSKARFQAI